MPTAGTIKKELEQRAKHLAERLDREDMVRAEYRKAGRAALSTADSILQGLEYALSQPDGVSLTARGGKPLPPITNIRIVRPDTAPEDDDWSVITHAPACSARAPNMRPLQDS